jgi:hypothetical protein
MDSRAGETVACRVLGACQAKIIREAQVARMIDAPQSTLMLFLQEVEPFASIPSYLWSMKAHRSATSSRKSHLAT